MRRSHPLLTALAGCLVACAPSPAPSATPPAPSADPTAETPPAAADADASPASPHHHGAEDPATKGKALNARYDEQTDPERWAAQFERTGREVHDRRAAIVDALSIAPGSVVADLGAGTGLFTVPFAQAVGEAGAVIAVDVQDYFLTHIDARAKAASLKNVRTHKATQDGAGLAPKSVDLAFLCDVYHHLEQPAAYLATVRAALKDGGRLAVIDYDRTREGAKDWLVNHIRADPETFQAEIEAAGFVRVAAPDVLEENFFFVFEVAAG